MVRSASRTAQSRPRRIFEAGQGLVEYALILVLVAVLAIGATVYLGGMAAGAMSNVADGLNGAPASSGGPVPQPTPVPPADYSTKKACTAAGYQWIAKNKLIPAHCQ